MTRRLRATPLGDVALAVALCLGVSGLVFGFGWGTPAVPPRPSSLLPPDEAIGAVWLLLFAGMGYARWRLRQVWSAEALRSGGWLNALMANDLAYTVYAIALGGPWTGLAGNAVAAALTLAFCRAAWRVDRTAAWVVAPQVPWLVLASLGTLQQLGLLPSR